MSLLYHGLELPKAPVFIYSVNLEHATRDGSRVPKDSTLRLTPKEHIRLTDQEVAWLRPYKRALQPTWDKQVAAALAEERRIRSWQEEIHPKFGRVIAFKELTGAELEQLHAADDFTQWVMACMLGNRRTPVITAYKKAHADAVPLLVLGSIGALATLITRLFV